MVACLYVSSIRRSEGKPKDQLFSLAGSDISHYVLAYVEFSIVICAI